MRDYLREEVTGTRGTEPEVSYICICTLTHKYINYICYHVCPHCAYHAIHIYAQWSRWHLQSQTHNFSMAQKNMYSVTRQDWLWASLLLWQGYDIILLSDVHLFLSKKAVTTPTWGRYWLSLTQVLSFHYAAQDWPKWHWEISLSPLSQRQL